jgi:methylglutaconyl-CoA hydratase
MDELRTLEISVAGKVATITLNRPDVRNAFNETAIADLTMAFDEVSQERTCAPSCWPRTARPSAPART